MSDDMYFWADSQHFWIVEAWESESYLIARVDPVAFVTELGRLLNEGLQVRVHRYETRGGDGRVETHAVMSLTIGDSPQDKKHHKFIARYIHGNDLHPVVSRDEWETGNYFAASIHNISAHRWN